MTSQQQRLWQELCLKAVMEPDPKKQTAIVVELNRILQNQCKKAHAVRANRSLASRKTTCRGVRAVVRLRLLCFHGFLYLPVFKKRDEQYPTADAP